MRPGAELQGWLDAADVRGVLSLADADPVQRPLDELGCALDALSARSVASRPDVEAAVLRALDPLFTDERWVHDLVAAEVAAAAANRFHQPRYKPLANAGGMVLIDHPLLLLSLRVVAGGAPARSATVTFPGATTRIRVCRSGGAEARAWLRDMGTDHASATARCRAGEAVPAADGAVLLFDGERRTITIDPGAGVLVLLEARLRGGPALACVFERAGGRLLTAGAADEEVGRVQLLLTLLRIQGRTEAADRFRSAIRHPAFQLRWYAMREFLALDPVAAIPELLHLAAADPHGEVRAAAAATVAQLGARYPALFVPAVSAA